VGRVIAGMAVNFASLDGSIRKGLNRKKPGLLAEVSETSTDFHAGESRARRQLDNWIVG